MYPYLTIPNATLIGMGVTALVSLLVPIILLIVWKKKTGTKALPVFFGIVTFIVFAMILEPICHQIVLNSSIGNTINSNIILYAIYGGLAAGIFEETGRLCAMRALMKKTLTPESSIMFGIGHGGCEAVLLGFFPGISNILTAVAINMAGVDTLLQTVAEDARAASYQQLIPLWTTPSYTFFLGGYERILAVCIHICCSYIVYRAISDKKIIRFFMAIAIHAFIDGVVVVINARSGALVAEAVLTVLVAVLVFFTIQEYRDRKREYDEAMAAAKAAALAAKETADAESAE